MNNGIFWDNNFELSHAMSNLYFIPHQNILQIRNLP